MLLACRSASRQQVGVKKPHFPSVVFFLSGFGGQNREISNKFGVVFAVGSALLSQRFSMSRETLPLKKRQRLDDAAAAEGGDDAAHHPSCPEQDPLALFDVDFRSHLIDGCADWAARAKAIAEQVRFGPRRDVMWWTRGSGSADT